MPVRRVGLVSHPAGAETWVTQNLVFRLAPAGVPLCDAWVSGTTKLQSPRLSEVQVDQDVFTGGPGVLSPSYANSCKLTPRRPAICPSS